MIKSFVIIATSYGGAEDFLWCTVGLLVFTACVFFAFHWKGGKLWCVLALLLQVPILYFALFFSHDFLLNAVNSHGDSLGTCFLLATLLQIVVAVMGIRRVFKKYPQ